MHHLGICSLDVPPLWAPKKDGRVHWCQPVALAKKAAASENVPSRQIHVKRLTGGVRMATPIHNRGLRIWKPKCNKKEDSIKLRSKFDIARVVHLCSLERYNLK